MLAVPTLRMQHWNLSRVAISALIFMPWSRISLRVDRAVEVVDDLDGAGRADVGARGAADAVRVDLAVGHGQVALDAAAGEVEDPLLDELLAGAHAVAAEDAGLGVLVGELARKRDSVTPHFAATSWTTGTLGQRPRYISASILRCCSTRGERVSTLSSSRTG